MSFGFLALPLTDLHAHERERTWRELEFAKQVVLRTLMESQSLLERAEQILSKDRSYGR
jgi:hypothetical protein